ncbi:MAG TPA: DUF2142 domain-containing protein [Verrucomicrobiae bacterium]|nr:DUF2142 domain-containing protein [Verrucomicrobiae bacterium]
MEAARATGKTERIVVLIICLLGAVHVFVFSAAFPFFSVVDEQVHLDLAVRYSQGDIPRSLTPVCAEALPYLAIYGAPEYLNPPGGTNPPPPWKQPIASISEKLAAKEAAYQQIFTNHEAASPPLYYGVAGGWWDLGKLLKMDGASLLYWMRFLNVPLVALVAWLGWLAARMTFPENLFIRLAVPLLIAFLPQSTFYAINNDVLTPLTFGAAFVLLLKLFDAEKLSPLTAAAAGLALAAAFLTKSSNVPLVAACAVFVGMQILILAWRGKLSASLLPLLVLLITAALPMAAWMAWCKTNFGDYTGSSPKIAFLGWTQNPSQFWLSHPIFIGHGLWYFVKQNLTTFWQGEALWHRQPLALPGVDQTYVVLTLGAFALTMAALLLRPPAFTTPQQSALWLGFLCIVGSFSFFALLSVKYDFQDCFYPSRAHPFFVSGRLMLGMLVPFLVWFACGLDLLLKRFGYATKFFMLLGLLAFMLASEITIDLPVFSNEYNWFHL